MAQWFIAIIYGIIEGITEWLPVSSTGHMILVRLFLPLNVSEEFWDVFLVVIQLGAILAVIFKYAHRLLPVWKQQGKWLLNKPVLNLWKRIIIATLPAMIIGLFLDDFIDALFFTPLTVAIMLITYGIIFIIIEKSRKTQTVSWHHLYEMPLKTALCLGFFQVLALIPGTSRSGAIIVGGLLLGISRLQVTEFSFYLALPVMVGASGLRLFKYGFNFTSSEIFIAITGLVTAFLVSLIALNFLVGYVKKHTFISFGIYRIILGSVILSLLFFT